MKIEEESSSKQVENTVGKGEIARYEQFFLFPQCFQKACFPWASKGVIVWEWVYSFPNDKFQTLLNSKSLQTTISNLMKMEESSSKQVENTV